MKLVLSKSVLSHSTRIAADESKAMRHYLLKLIGPLLGVALLAGALLVLHRTSRIARKVILTSLLNKDGLRTPIGTEILWPAITWKTDGSDLIVGTTERYESGLAWGLTVVNNGVGTESAPTLLAWSVFVPVVDGHPNSKLHSGAQVIEC